MLRLKQAMDELKIPQQEFVKYSGWSKTQVSLTLKSGKLPANSAKFAADVQNFAEHHPEIIHWLGERDLDVPALLECLDTPAAESAPDLERVLCEIAGRQVLAIPNEDNGLVVRLIRTNHYLYSHLCELMGKDAPYMTRLTAEAVGMLENERS
ncbi:hypothetical protein [Geobacter sp. SVR]|uniref:hypothetical protein n=1 Tax=Geobacter sp. SVR TaxID=2495594 RepID=UPI00143EF528|nr:hypothetical protein [Geobacter sp. SVR]BCS55163.1 hypothetical protein GSVR_34710 [Geobacter sp. SVR]GCF85344.1 hypothetical protein GSbR_19440 [Geobacter sp. SVR]